MKNKQTFAKYMTILAEIHTRELSKTLLDVYWVSLQPYDDNECESAFNRMVTTLKFFPKPADMLEAINHVSTKQIPGATDRATEQVAVVMKQVRELGYYRTPVFDDPVTKRLMTSRWSWQAMCSMTAEEHKWWAKEFVDAYRASELVNSTGDDQQIEFNNNRRLKLLVGGIGR